MYALIETRDNLVKSTTVFKNQIHNIFVQHGITLTTRQVATEKNLNKLLVFCEFDETTMFHLKLAKKAILQNIELSDEIEDKLNELKFKWRK